MTDRTEQSNMDYSVGAVEHEYMPAVLPLTPVDLTKDSALNEEASIPKYLQDTYYWGYLNPRNVSLLDHEFVVKSILWWQHKRLRAAAFAEISPASRVLQAAAVYGDFSRDLADHIGHGGELKIIDVAPIQVRNTKIKLSAYPQAQVELADASTFNDQPFDVVICYFLLHEIPDDYKTLVMDNLLKHIRHDGKLVIIDYHKPHWAHPIKPVTSLVFNVLEPYAKTLWRASLRELASAPDDYHWDHYTYFGGMFQKVVVRHNK